MSAINYIFNIVVARLLGPIDFGEYMALASIMYLVLIPVGSLVPFAMKYVVPFTTNNDLDSLKQFDYLVSRKLLQIGMIIALGFLVASPLLSSFLHLSDIMPIVILSFMFTLIFVLNFKRGILRGMHKNGTFVLTQITEVAIKFTLAMFVIWLGWRVTGVMGAIVLSVLFGYLLVMATIPYKLKKADNKPLDITMTKDIKQYASVVVIALLALTLFHTSDVIAVKHLFPSEIAGMYSALSILGKMIYFAAMAVIGAMFPLIVSQNVKKQSHIKEFKQAFLLVSLVCLGGIIVFHVFAGWIVTLFFGAEYIEIIPLVGAYSIFISIVVFNSLFIHYFLSIGYKRFLPYVCGAALLQIAMLVVSHENLLVIIRNLILINFLLLLVTLVNYYFLKQRTYG